METSNLVRSLSQEESNPKSLSESAQTIIIISY